MATTKSSSPRRKSKTVARRAAHSATKTAHRRPPGKTRQSKAAGRASTGAKSRRKAVAASSDNPPLSPEIRATLSQLKKRGESIVSQLTASLSGKKKRAPKSTAKPATHRKAGRATAKAK